MKYMQKITAFVLALAAVCVAPSCTEETTDSGVPDRLFRPVNVQVSAKETTVTAKWAGIDGATGYCAELYVRNSVDDGSGKFEDKVLVARDENVQGTTWAVTGLLYNTQYYFRVKANNPDVNMNSHFTDFTGIKTPIETQVLKYTVDDPLKGVVTFTWMDGYNLTFIRLTAADGSETIIDINDADLKTTVSGLAAGNYTAVAGNESRTYNVLQILIPVLYEVNKSDITFDGVTLRWAPDGNLSAIRCTNLATAEELTFSVDGNAGEKTISTDQLGFFQTYTVVMTYLDGGLTNAVKFTTLDRKPEGMVIVSSYAELKQALIDVPNGGVIGMNPGVYEVKEDDGTGLIAYAALDISKGLTLMAATGEQPKVIFKQFSLKNTSVVDLVRIEGIEFEGFDEADAGNASSYFFDLNTGSATVNRVEVVNCFIHGISNSIVRADRSVTATVLNVLVDNCILLNMNGKQAYVSTYISDAGVAPESIVFTNNTVTGLSWKSANQRAFGYLASTGHLFKMSNNTFYNCQSGTANFILARGSKDGSYGTVVIQGNLFYNKPVDATKNPNKAPTFGTSPSLTIENNVLTFPWGTYNSTSGVLTTDDWSQYGASTADPKFADPANNDFTITNAEVAKLKVGDPRWIPAE